MQNQKQLMTVAEPNVLLKLPGIEKVYVLYFFFFPARTPQRNAVDFHYSYCQNKLHHGKMKRWGICNSVLIEQEIPLLLPQG